VVPDSSSPSRSSLTNSATWGGYLFQDPKHVRQDLRFLRTAVREGWGVSPETLHALRGRLQTVLNHPKLPPGTKARALRLLAGDWFPLN
jgi:hypothetical protein